MKLNGSDSKKPIIFSLDVFYSTYRANFLRLPG